jgi:hypothetical protein
MPCYYFDICHDLTSRLQRNTFPLPKCFFSPLFPTRAFLISLTSQNEKLKKNAKIPLKRRMQKIEIWIIP